MSGIRPKNCFAVGGFAPPIVVLVLLAVAALTACERRPVGRSSDDPGPVVAKVDGHALYQKDLEAYLPETERGEVLAATESE